jgi:antirestriction protein ArdC
VVPAFEAFEDGTEYSETLVHKIQTPGNHPKERIQQINKC